MELMEPGVRYLTEAEYKQTEAGKIPTDWNVHKLADVAEIQTGIAKNTEAKLNDPVEVPYLRVANVQDGFLNLEDVAQIRMNRSNVKRYLLQPGDVLMNEGGDLDKLGRGALWHGQINPCVHQNHVFAVRCKEKLTPQFLNAWTSSAPARRFFMLAGRQTTNLASINKTSLGQLPVPIPSDVVEQEAIARALNDVDCLIDSLKQYLEKKRLLKQGAMHELLKGERRLLGYSKEWIAKPLGKVARIQRGASPRPIDSPIWFDENSSVGWVRISDVTQSGTYLHSTSQRLSTLGIKNSRPVPKDSLIMSICATVGRPVITTIDTCIHDGFVVFDNPQADRLFLYYVLRNIEERWSRHGQTGSQMNLNTNLINKTEVPIPLSKKEQTAIGAVLADMDSEIQTLENRLTKARHLKQAMMQELLTGRIRLVQAAA